jgi:hypothetical protein
VRPFVTDDLIFMTLAGSHMYGTNGPDSDIDKRGVCIPPRNVVMGFARNFEQQIFEGEDTVVFGLTKFMKLAIEANPNILELLFAPEDCVLKTSPIWAKLLEHRDKFVSAKCYHTLVGYAHAQLSKIRGHREWIKNPPTHKPTRQEFGLQEAGSGVVSVSKGVDLTEVSPEMLVLLDKEKRYKATLRRWDDYQRWREERNPARAKLEAKFFYDTKHALHLVRLLRMGHEVLTTGKLIVRRPDAEELLAIRHGAMTYEQLMELIDPLKTKLDEIYESGSYVVPFGAPKEEISDLCVELHELYWSSRLS